MTLRSTLVLSVPVQMSWASRCSLRLPALCSALVFVAAVPVLAQQKIIDGSKNPELLPQWFVWQETFRTIVVHPDREKLEKEVGLTDDEFKFLLGEQAAHSKRETSLATQLRTTGEALRTQGLPPERIAGDLAALDFDYRWQVLYARQRIHDKLSPESLARLEQWIYRHVISAAKVHLSGSAVQRFFSPW